MSESQKHRECEESDLKEFILYDSILQTSQNMKSKSY